MRIRRHPTRPANGWHLAIGLCACLPLSACGGDDSVLPTYTVSDSAGIAVVHSSAPFWKPGEEWTVAPGPYLEIGSVDGEEPYLLDRVVGVSTLTGDRIAVAMSSDNSIRIYDESGVYITRLGGRGEGPGEFSFLSSLHRGAGRLYGGQPPGQTINVFDEESGEFLEGVALPTMSGPAANFRGVLDDGSMIFRMDAEQDRPASGVYSWRATLTRLSISGRLDTLGVFPAQAFVLIGEGGATAQQFGPNLRVAVGRDEIHTGRTDDYTITEHAPEGEARSIIRRAWEPRPVTDDDVARRKEESRSMGANEQAVDAMIYPQFHPAFAGILVSRSGHLWIQRHDANRTRLEEVMGLPDETPTPWDVFSPEGVWLGTVEQPARLRILEIGDDYLAGVWVNELGVQFVRFYRIEKPQS